MASSLSFSPDHALLDAFSEGVMVLDAAWRVRFVNRAAEGLFQIPRSELEDKILGRDLLYTQQEHVSVFRDVMRDRKRRPLGTFRSANDREQRVVQVDVCPIEASGKPVGIAIVYRDITAWTAREVEARGEDTGTVHEFIAAMAHEIRTPVHAILGYAELLRLDAGSLAEPQATHLARLEASTQHLLHLVDDLLDFGRLATGRLPLELAAGNARSVALAALDVVSIKAQTRGITLVQECDELPVMYLGDEDRVRQVLLNLLMNAIKFTNSGGRIAISCGTAPAAGAAPLGPESDAWVYFQVRDSGIGIAPEELDAIFEPYRQLQRGRPYRQGGVGLGLALSRELARHMHGDLVAESAPDAGSTFTLWLPASQVTVDE